MLSRHERKRRVKLNRLIQNTCHLHQVRLRTNLKRQNFGGIYLLGISKTIKDLGIHK